MSNYYNTHAYNSPSGGPVTPPVNKNSFKKGLGFIPSSMAPAHQDPIAVLISTLPKFSRVCSPVGTHIGGSNIPQINLDHLSETSGETRRRLIKSFGDALRQEGFVAISAHQLSPLIDQVHEEIKQYFRKPFEQKLLDWQAKNGIQGYFHQGSEFAPGSKYADIKESYYIPHAFEGWPKNSASFSRTLSEYHSYLYEYAKSLLKVLYEYLGQPHADVERWFSQKENLLRATHYPTLKPNDHPESLWAAPHKDLNAITVMSPGTIPGLQKLEPNGHWKPVIVPKGYLIITTGLMLEHKTAGLIKARVHRVINPGGKNMLAERYSTAFFGQWKPDFSLEPFESCLEIVTYGMSTKRKMSFLKQYPKITVQEKETCERACSIESNMSRKEGGGKS